MTKDKLKVIGEIEGLQSSDNGKTWEKFFYKRNLITDRGIQNFYNCYTGDDDTYNIKFVAVGNGSSTASKSDTIIDGEYGRYAITSQTVKTINSHKWIESIINFDSGEANGTIRKIGLIGHGPTTTLSNYDPADPDKAGADWILSNYADVLMPNGKLKTTELIFKFIWRVKIE